MIDWRTTRGTLEAVARRAVFEPEQRRVLGAVLLGLPSWWGTVRAGRLADHVLAPGQRRQQIRAPIFVVGHPRSGTTFLHRLLASNEIFCAPRAWELALPAVTLHRLGEVARRTGAGRRVAHRLEEALFEPFASRHATRWGDPEEDDWLLLQGAASPTLEFLTGEPGLTARYWIGDALPERERTAWMRWYRRSVQRILFATDPGATWLSKNPHFTGWMRTLAAAFPDARFVMLVREPEEAIASRMSLLARAWFPDDPAQGRGDARFEEVFRESCALYRHAEEVWTELPGARRLRVRYGDLVRDPEAAVRRVHAHFDLPLSSSAAEDVARGAAAARRRVPRAPSRLRHFGIHPRRLREELDGADALWSSLGGSA